MRFKTVRVSRTHREGTKQADAILRAARKVFIKDGPSGFSARRVADEAALSLGSVQHVFPTVDSLLVAMLEYVISDYEKQYVALARGLPFTSEARLSAIIDYLIDDVFKQDTRCFFFGFWVLSCHNKLVSRLFTEAYAYHAETLAATIAAVRSDCDEAGCLAIARQVAALIEGWMIFTTQALESAEGKRRRQLLREGVDTLIRNSKVQSRPAAARSKTRRRGSRAPDRPAP
jgi:AcrR family transcriptional regulator